MSKTIDERLKYELQFWIKKSIKTTQDDARKDLANNIKHLIQEVVSELTKIDVMEFCEWNHDDGVEKDICSHCQGLIRMQEAMRKKLEEILG